MTQLENAYSSDWIDKLESELHWRLYWRQQHLMEGHINKGDKILEIGVGSSFTANYLKSRGHIVTTVDIDQEKKPDIVANIMEWRPDYEFDHILAFEVFEHIPFSDFQKSFEILSDYCRKYFFLSLPECTNECLGIEFRTIKGYRLDAGIRLKRPIRTKHHHWELGVPGSTLKDLEEFLRTCGRKIVEHNRFRSWNFFLIE